MMKESEKKRYLNYLYRFIDPEVPFRQKWVAFWRYLGMALGLVVEKVRGVDYSLIYHEDNPKENCGDYTMSPKKVLKRVFADVDDIQKKAFLDVGCGKGYAIKRAAKEGFKRYGGVEYNQYLYDICISNLKKEKITADYVFCGMAQEYEGYGDFDIFYFNNPFQAEILRLVLNKIYESHRGKKCRCYFLNPNDIKKEQAFIDAGFEMVKVIEDSAESYFKMNVYEN